MGSEYGMEGVPGFVIGPALFSAHQPLVVVQAEAYLLAGGSASFKGDSWFWPKWPRFPLAQINLFIVRVMLIPCSSLIHFCSLEQQCFLLPVLFNYFLAAILLSDPQPLLYTRCFPFDESQSILYAQHEPCRSPPWGNCWLRPRSKLSLG